MDMYLHDSSSVFRFVLRGELAGEHVTGLRHAWITAQSILGNKELVVDVSGVALADSGGLELLSEMRESGARLTAALTPRSAEFLRGIGVPLAAPIHRASALARLRHAVTRIAGCRRNHDSPQRQLTRAAVPREE